MRITAIGQGSAALPARIYEDAEAQGAALAAELAAGIVQAARLGRRFLLGCPGGRSGRSTYAALAGLAAERGLDLHALVVVMMDNYVEDDGHGGYRDCPDEAHYSCRRFAHEEIRDVLNRELPTQRWLPREQVWSPDPRDPAAYDERIRAAGGIDCFILASGASDGHVAFNPPGSALESGTRIVAIAEATRRDNLGTFPEFAALEQVPTHGVTVGLATIVELSRAVALIVNGAHKRAALSRLHRCDGFDPDWPVSCVFACRQAQVSCDAAAAAEELS